MLGYTTLWFIINHNTCFRLHQFSDIHISQGSVETCLGCGGIVKLDFVANLPRSLPVKEFCNSVNIWESYGQEFGVLFFWDSVVCSVCHAVKITHNVSNKNTRHLWSDLLNTATNFLVAVSELSIKQFATAKNEIWTTSNLSSKVTWCHWLAAITSCYWQCLQ